MLGLWILGSSVINATPSGILLLLTPTIQRNYLPPEQSEALLATFVTLFFAFFVPAMTSIGVGRLSSRYWPRPSLEEGKSDWRDALFVIQSLMILLGAGATVLGVFMQTWPFRRQIDLPFWEAMVWVSLGLLCLAVLMSLLTRVGDLWD